MRRHPEIRQSELLWLWRFLVRELRKYRKHSCWSHVVRGGVGLSDTTFPGCGGPEASRHPTTKQRLFCRWQYVYGHTSLHCHLVFPSTLANTPTPLLGAKSTTSTSLPLSNETIAISTSSTSAYAFSATTSHQLVSTSTIAWRVKILHAITHINAILIIVWWI